MAVDRRIFAWSTLVLLVGSISGLVAVADLGLPPGMVDGVHGRSSAEHAEGAAQQAGYAGGLSPWGLDPAMPPELAHAHAFPAGVGSIPTRAEALDFAKRYSSFRAEGDDALASLAEDEHLSGSGTLADPYVLARFYVDGDLIIESTGRAIILREGYVTGQLKLNYIGSEVLVHHVYAKDLRVNENIDRYGTDTGGLFHDNAFGFIGQLRHFSGEFRDNSIGPRPNDVVSTYLGDAGVMHLGEDVVFNFDGFHGASVHGNQIEGAVDIKLHGHYHGDCLACTPHDHADRAHFPDAEEDEDGDGDGGHAHHHAHGASHHDLASPEERTWLLEKGLRSHHSIRYHSLHFFDNEIRVEKGYALRYYDRAHEADDVTASSEPNPYLRDPHVHFQYVWLQENTLKGGALFLDVFNAEDSHHVLANEGVLRIEGNTIEVPFLRELDPPAVLFGMLLTQADGIALVVAGNTVRFVEASEGPIMSLLPSSLKRAPELVGMRLNTFDRGNVTLIGNTVTRADVGIVAAQFGERLWWDLVANSLDAHEPVRTHNVANPAGAQPGDDDTEDDPDAGPEPDPDPHAHPGHQGGS